MNIRRALQRHHVITAESHILTVGDMLTVKTAHREVIRVGRLVVPVSRWRWFEYIDSPWPEGAA